MLLGVVVVGLVATFGMNFQVLVPPLADNVLHVGASGFGFLMAASGVGSTITALWVAFSRKVGPTPIVMGAIALGLGSILLAASSSYGIALVAMFIVGAGGIGMAVTANTTIQMAVPDQLRGRVMSVYTTVFAGSVPAGGLLMGAIASVWGVPLALMVGAVLSTGMMECMRRRLGAVGEPYREGRCGRFARSAQILRMGGAALMGARGRSSRAAAVVGGAGLVAGAICQRWAVFEAGKASASDPKYTTAPQRKRLATGD